MHAVCAGLPRYVSATPVFIVLHMPEGFADIVASQLERVTGIPASATRADEIARPGHFYVAASGAHLKLERIGSLVRLKHQDSEPVNYCKPSADILFKSAAEVYGPGTIGVVLSGMGTDGLEGCRAIVSAGGRVLVQDEASSAVWGMPGAVVRNNIASRVLPPDRIAQYLQMRLGRQDLSVA